MIMLASVISSITELQDPSQLQLPSASGVFLLQPSQKGADPYIGRTADLRRRIRRLLSPPAPYAKGLNFHGQCSHLEWSLTGSDFETRLLFLQLLRERFPGDYAKRLRLRPAALVRMHWENNYPRAYVTRKWKHAPSSADVAHRSVFFGPFASRKSADAALQSVLDLFLSRRCTFELHPDPAFPGCVYSEMKMCLAPCFKGCTDERYMEEVGRVQQFLEEHGASMRMELEAARERASAELHFEEAAELHVRIDKVKEAARQFDEIIHRLDRMDAVILQKSHLEDHVSLFHFTDGILVGPTRISTEVDPVEKTPVLKQRLSDCLTTTTTSEAVGARIASENLALLKRWYYSSRRIGEIFFADEDGVWPLQKMVNGVVRVLGH